METSLKTDFAQIFSRCAKNLSCPKFGGAAAPLAPPARTPMGGVLWISSDGDDRIGAKTKTQKIPKIYSG